MSEISVEQVSQEKLEAMGVFSWPIWEKEVSKFPWFYESVEMCYILEGGAVVIPKDGRTVCISAGDLVTFPAHMSCMWEILSDLKKHYIFV